MRRTRTTLDADVEVTETRADDAVDPQQETAPAVPTRPYWDFVPAGLSIALGVAALSFSEGLSEGIGAVPGARFWPSILGWCLIGLGAALAVTVLLPRRVQPEVPEAINGNGVLRLALTTVLLLGYLSLWGVLPFWMITLATSIALMALFGMRGWKALLLFPAIVVTIIQLLFIVALRIPL